MFNDRRQKVKTAGPVGSRRDPRALRRAAGRGRPGGGRRRAQGAADRDACARSGTSSRARRRARITLEDLHKQIAGGRGQGAAAHPQGRRAGLGGGAGRIARAPVAPTRSRLKVIHGSVGHHQRDRRDAGLGVQRHRARLQRQGRAEGGAARRRPTAWTCADYNVIYEAINDVKAALAGMLAAGDSRDARSGGRRSGSSSRSTRSARSPARCVIGGQDDPRRALRVRRGDDRARRGQVTSLKRFKDDAREVHPGSGLRYRRGEPRRFRPATSSRPTRPRKSRGRSSAAGRPGDVRWSQVALGLVELHLPRGRLAQGQASRPRG